MKSDSLALLKEAKGLRLHSLFHNIFSVLAVLYKIKLHFYNILNFHFTILTKAVMLILSK